MFRQSHSQQILTKCMGYSYPKDSVYTHINFICVLVCHAVREMKNCVCKLLFKDLSRDLVSLQLLAANVKKYFWIKSDDTREYAIIVFQSFTTNVVNTIRLSRYEFRRVNMMLYKNTKVKVRSPVGDRFFYIAADVLQGDTLAPYLFIISLDYLLKYVYRYNER